MFSGIQGHTKTIQVLSRLVDTCDMPKCILLHGPDGVGKSKVAISLARSLNCTTGQGHACACRTCKRILQGMHQDVVEYFPDGSSFKIAQVREILKESEHGCLEGRHKVIILHGAELLTHQAADALLKTLENGRHNLLFVLSSTMRNKIVPTLVSRCLDLYMGALPDDVVMSVLNSIGISLPANLLPYAKGSVGNAMRIAQNGENILNQIRDVLRQYPAIPDFKILSFVTENLPEKDDILFFLDVMATYLEIESLQPSDVKWTKDKTLKILQRTLDTRDVITEYPVSAQYHTMNLLLNLKEVFR
jgi:DNA polymerase-3 subunit delta'